MGAISIKHITKTAKPTSYVFLYAEWKCNHTTERKRINILLRNIIPFPMVYAVWSLVFWSFRIMLCYLEKNCFKLNNNNNWSL